MKGLKPPKPKPINFELIPPMDGTHEPEPYRILRTIREAHHPDLAKARIALAWRKKLKRDRDGHLVLGKCVKITDLQREFHEFDYVILLNREVWLDDAFTPEKKHALIDHELCHADAARDKDGFPKRDERDRFVWRTRKHDIEEFRDVVRRHGCYKADLEEFAQALLVKRSAPLFAQPAVSDETIATVCQSAVDQVNAGALDRAGIKVTASLVAETSTEERARTHHVRRTKKALASQAAILPDKRTAFPHGHNGAGPVQP